MLYEDVQDLSDVRLLQFVKTIVGNSTIAEMVKSLSTRHISAETWAMCQYKCWLMRPWLLIGPRYRAAVNEVVTKPTSHRKCTSLVIGLILLAAKNLSSFSYDSRWFLNMQDLCSLMTLSPTIMMPHLQHLSMIGSSTGKINWDFSMLYHMLAVSKATRVALSNCSSPVRGPWDPGYNYNFSFLRTIELYHCRLDLEEFGFLFRSCTRITSFAYVESRKYTWDGEDHEACGYVGEIVDALTIGKDKIRTLFLKAYFYETGTNFEDFTALRHLRLDRRDLTCGDEEFLSTFPKSLRLLRIDNATKRVVPELLRLCEPNRAGLPKLQTIQLTARKGKKQEKQLGNALKSLPINVEVLSRGRNKWKVHDA